MLGVFIIYVTASIHSNKAVTINDELPQFRDPRSASRSSAIGLLGTVAWHATLVSDLLLWFEDAACVSWIS